LGIIKENKKEKKGIFSYSFLANQLPSCQTCHQIMNSRVTQLGY